MRLSNLLLSIFRFLLPPAIVGTVYLYLYPLLQGCSFPAAKRAEAASYLNGTNQPTITAETAPFRLLALGDPQLEGDTSLPGAHSAAEVWSVWNRGKGERSSCETIRALAGEDLPRILRWYRKRLDLWGNDLYLAHIYRSVRWWTRPTHTVVLGDLLGSQWIGDDEFARRSERFWERVFRHAEMVPHEITDVSGRVEVLGADKSWERRIIAVAGNHDIGYAGDINKIRLERFERVYGRVNWEVRFTLAKGSTSDPNQFAAGQPTPFAPGLSPPTLRLVILNSMNLDSPALDSEMQRESLEFLDEHITNTPFATSGKSATVLLYHIPLHKERGVCVDAPFFSYFPSSQGGGIKEQNHLSREISARILDGLTLGNGNHQAVILNGHDHEGCDTFHSLAADAAFSQASFSPPANSTLPEPDEPSWIAQCFHSGLHTATETAGIREITVKSMMGSFGGNAGLFSAWFDLDEQRWRFEYATCVLGVQHFWWAVHVLDVVVLLLGLAWVAAVVAEEVVGGRQRSQRSGGEDSGLAEKKRI